MFSANDMNRVSARFLENALRRIRTRRPGGRAGLICESHHNSCNGIDIRLARLRWHGLCSDWKRLGEDKLALKSVLVADDSRICRVLTREVLRDHHLHVFEAADGKEALELMVTYRPELVVLDLLMPRLSGFEVLLQLAERVPEYKPVIFVYTAVFKSRRWESETRHNYQIHEYLEKSLEPSGLLAAITRHFPEFNAPAKPAARLPHAQATSLAMARPLLS